MIIDGHLLTTFQSCRRRHLLEREYSVVRWRPKSLFDACLRQAIAALSDGQTAAGVIQEARTRFLSQAANPGLDFPAGTDSWVVANDYAGMLATVLTAVSRLTLLALQPLSPAAPSPEWSWQFSSLADESGALHRWVTCDRFDDDTLMREAHGWRVFGDICVADAPLTLHVIEIGKMSKGRRQSPWVRAWSNPNFLYNKFKFQANDPKGGHRALRGEGWRPFWYAEQPKPDAGAWVDTMDAEGVTPGLLHHIAIRQPSDAVRQDTLRQIGRVAAEASALAGEWWEQPMSRGQCDGLIPCPWQDACMRDKPAEGIAELGLYRIKGDGASGRSSLQAV